MAVPTSTVNARYPLGARLRGEEGIVEIQAILGASGRATEVNVLKTSGYSALDRSALKAMREARFKSISGASLSGVEVTKTFRYVLVD
ncbi:hypothetical protein BVX94_02490 [bacterium B17]|nr:hypothetical protein BVX94_02490 [bacterium B17]